MIKKDRQNVDYLIKKVHYNREWSKTTGFLTFSSKFEPFVIKLELFLLYGKVVNYF